MSQFELAYRVWLDKHIAESRGERRRRIKERHGFGEKSLLEHAWWPVIGNLDDICPEYEFVDSEGNHVFMDFAYIRLPKPTCLESDSFGTHARDADRWTFSRGLDRQNEIALAGWNVLRFSIDKLKENPEACRKHLRTMLTNWYGSDEAHVLELNLYQREILRLATRSSEPVTVDTVRQVLGRSDRFAREQLHQMVENRILEPASGHQRIRSYRLRRDAR
ncbi:DNA-binding response regulator [Cohnella endophytica]|uniref:DNA-binding response regulator n=1 Tax=Cohnella endophytica TaxID=2419778 RepID=A0A494XDE9_9BACL|nr:DNA-binding response regulator [Cohnella endophytica]RKP48785.1 DNA-binding response regulator [Cohnella endophytica]